MDKFIFAGKYSGNPEDIPGHEHEPGAEKYREADDMKKLGIWMNLAALLLLVPLLVLLIVRGGFHALNIWGCLASVLVMVPHELIHGLCFRGTVYMYQNLSQGMLFVTGTETFTKTEFIFMSMLPSLIFGFLPYILFMIWPELTFLGTLGAISITSGTGDYYNVYNTIRQVPKGGRVYMHGINTWWYLPEDNYESI